MVSAINHTFMTTLWMLLHCSRYAFLSVWNQGPSCYLFLILCVIFSAADKAGPEFQSKKPAKSKDVSNMLIKTLRPTAPNDDSRYALPSLPNFSGRGWVCLSVLIGPTAGLLGWQGRNLLMRLFLNPERCPMRNPKAKSLRWPLQRFPVHAGLLPALPINGRVQLTQTVSIPWPVVSLLLYIHTFFFLCWMCFNIVLLSRLAMMHVISLCVHICMYS